MSDATHERLVAITTKLLSRMFGGATAIRASYGGWYSEDLGRLIVEQPSLVFAFSDTLTPLEIERVTRFARLMRRVARQEAIAVILDGRMQFI